MLSAQTIILQNKIVFVGSHFNTVLIKGWVESFLAGSGYGFSQSGSGYGFSQSGSQSGKIRKPIRVRLRIFRVSAEAVNSTNFLNCNLLWPWNPHWRLHKVKTLTKQFCCDNSNSFPSKWRTPNLDLRIFLVLNPDLSLLESQLFYFLIFGQYFMYKERKISYCTRHLLICQKCQDM